MKKKGSLVFSIFITVIILLTTFTSAAAESVYINGDADVDGNVTILDATAIQRKLAEFNVVSFDEQAADVDGNGLDITDATRIQRYLAGYSDPYHIGEIFGNLGGEIVGDSPTPTEDEYELPFVPK